MKDTTALYMERELLRKEIEITARLMSQLFPHIDMRMLEM